MIKVRYFGEVKGRIEVFIELVNRRLLGIFVRRVFGVLEKGR